MENISLGNPIEMSFDKFQCPVCEKILTPIKYNKYWILETDDGKRHYKTRCNLKPAGNKEEL